MNDIEFIFNPSILYFEKIAFISIILVVLIIITITTILVIKELKKEVNKNEK